MRLLPVLFGLLVVVASGATHGYLTQRWGPGGELERAAAVVDKFPDEFGSWRVQSSEPMEPIVIETLRCANYVNRVYLNTKTSEQVSIAVIVGPPGPTAVHTPEICYSSHNYTQLQAKASKTIEVQQQEHSFWVTHFKPNKSGASELSVYYAWTADERWHASQAPRFEYGGAPFLYKIQIASNDLHQPKEVSTDACHRFLEDLLSSNWKREESQS